MDSEYEHTFFNILRKYNCILAKKDTFPTTDQLLLAWNFARSLYSFI